MRRCLCTVLLIAGVSSAHAEDHVWVKGKSLQKGEIIHEGENGIDLVTLDGTALRIEKGEVVKIVRDRPLPAAVREKLEAVPEGDAAALLEVARFAQAQGLDREARRVALRILFFAPDHAEARALLGHCRVFGTWFVDQAAAVKAEGKRLKDEGYVKSNGGFVRSDDREDLQSAPEEWTLEDGLIWRRIADLMTERGFVEWAGDWYPPEERHLVALMEVLKERTGLVAHGAEVGKCRIISSLSRTECTKWAEKMAATRRQITELLACEHSERVRGLMLENYILDTNERFQAFVEAYGKELKFRQDFLHVFLTEEYAYWNRFNQVTHVGQSRWERGIVRDMGGAILDQVWVSESALPLCLERSLSHLAEEKAFGRVESPFHMDRDDPAANLERWYSYAEAAAESEDGWIKVARSLDEAHRLPALREQFEAQDWNQRTAELDVSAPAHLRFLLAEKRDFLLRFLGTPGQLEVDLQFRRSFGADFESVDEEFRAWLRREPEH
ncbi:MAG: hypothetical protein HY812_08280 [Planctomycetes bacterium]|nr:hypothetical protein [Planctomycetota bacterium]